MGSLTPELESYRHHIECLAKKKGLDFFDTIFELISYEQMRALASYEGFSLRYPHWRFGMNYHRFLKSDEYGLSKIYELVINHDPCYAYLLESNKVLDQKLVMAHVFGHADFFKHNKWFSCTNRKMSDTMKVYHDQVCHLIDKHGYEKIEKTLDHFLVLENLIDPYSPYRLQHKLSSKPSLPSETSPIKDILLFLMHYGDLEDWEVSLLSIVRDEAYYFAPQYMTKVMNEGWASYWHSKIMTESLVNHKEIVGFAERHSSATAMQVSQFNPYKVGLALFRYIEEVSKDEAQPEKASRKIFEVRKNYNDATFINEFLTREFCERFRIPFAVDKRVDVDICFRRWKDQLLNQMFNLGHPLVKLLDCDYEGGGLFIEHVHENFDLDSLSMRKCMESLFFSWKKPIWLKTKQKKEEKIICFDGKDYK